ncbi:adenosylcobinamide kinase/adenosylcobinamide phosphate guanyltransferase [Lysinibacillus alkalisoli]|uniref:Adenosylcobinamide kinase n=1 Tax=Lysinibacillus alkalisoli TaxID=1911548 RepID=A0A917G9M2_9BACI|nr:bifunctional adenosylcobinamide kinase/adenosylcobinamide-phosphate guanylyltransferase [Lysinibacillus alkalisoli]GGG31571.1 adenosylcobinamide kinase/adenosylcobinamide phosphate guanyltransferase [Lysinibacillus alkalisoli]
MIFIAGGVRSGKSAFAEQLAKQKVTTGRLVYMASGVATDSEMHKRIKRHQKDRAESDYNWHTIEASVHIEAVLKTMQPHDVVVWDCVTTWLTNLLYMPLSNQQLSSEETIAKTIEQTKAAIIALPKTCTLIIVSNELFDEPELINNEMNRYRKKLGHLHEWFVAQSDEAYELTEGIVKRWK